MNYLIGWLFFSNPLQLGWPYISSPNIAYADSEVSIMDSRTTPGESTLSIDDCVVTLKTSKMKDLCYIQDRVQKECGTFYELEKNCDKK